MSKTGRMKITHGDLLTSLQDFFKSILSLDEIEAILLPQALPAKNMVMPALVSDPTQLSAANPLAPCFPMNAAKAASRLTRKSAGATIAAVLRPCEIRAFIELVKLHQGTTEEILLIGFDCLGAFSNADYFKVSGGSISDMTLLFCKEAVKSAAGTLDGVQIAKACQACEQPTAEGADLSIGLYGMDIGSELLIEARTEKGAALFDRLGIDAGEPPAGREEALKGLIAARTEFRDRMFAETAEAVESVEKLSTYLANCVNCYNCRVACPVCYCKECVFTTDVFDHEPSQYLRWARRKGKIKIPTDTTFYHITRIAHMSTACVGCGQCSNACPNDVSVMALFRTLAWKTQKAFDYAAGRSLEEKPPLSEFRENEFSEVVGI